MQAAREGSRITLTLGAVESRVLRRIFRAISRHYQIPPAEMDPPAAAAWYGTRGCEAARMSPDETREWVENLHQVKRAQLHRLEQWIAQVSAGAGKHCQLRLELDEAAQLMTVVNDHRLLTAAQNEIGQAEMDAHSFVALRKLKPAQQNALYEIHFLAYLIEELIPLLAAEP